MYDKNNVFAKIIRGELDAEKLYEDDQVIVMKDIYPSAPIHILAIPKGEYTSFDDFTAKASIEEIGHFYKAEILEEFIMKLPISAKLEIFFSREAELLGTGGGIKNALSILGKEPFFVINNDAVLIDDENSSSLQQLQQNWQPSIMYILIL